MALSRLGAAGGSTPTPSPQESDHERRMRESGEKYDAWVDNLANKIDAVENNLGSGGRGGNMNGGGGGGGGGGWGGGPNDPLPPPDSPSGKALPFLVAFVGLVQCYFIYNEYEVEMNMGVSHVPALHIPAPILTLGIRAAALAALPAGPGQGGWGGRR